MSASIGAPTFKIATTVDVLDSNFDLHYVEYDSTITTKNNWIDGSIKNIYNYSETPGPNKIYGKQYSSLYG